MPALPQLRVRPLRRPVGSSLNSRRVRPPRRQRASRIRNHELHHGRLVTYHPRARAHHCPGRCERARRCYCHARGTRPLRERGLSTRRKGPGLRAWTRRAAIGLARPRRRVANVRSSPRPASCASWRILYTHTSTVSDQSKKSSTLWYTPSLRAAAGTMQQSRGNSSKRLACTARSARCLRERKVLKIARLANAAISTHGRERSVTSPSRTVHFSPTAPRTHGRVHTQLDQRAGCAGAASTTQHGNATRPAVTQAREACPAAGRAAKIRFSPWIRNN